MPGPQCPHCHWTDGGIIDLEAVGTACRRVGAVLCMDGLQSVGALRFDVGRCRAAPAGWPIEHHWIARRCSREFAGLVNYQHEFQDGARRFGGPLHIAEDAMASDNWFGGNRS
jgi:hypothetical protein